MNDTTDPLTRWITPKREPTVGPTGKPIYEAFKALDRRQLRLELCPRRGTWEAMPYLGLTRITRDRDYGTRLGLVWSFATVIITGRHLQEVARAVRQEHCEFLREFDAEQFDPPADGSALIESIEIHTATQEEEIGDAPYPRA